MEKNNQKYLSIIFALIALVIILLLFLKGCGNDLKNNEEPIAFKDQTFEKMIKKELDKDKVYPSDLKGYSGILIASDILLSVSGNGKAGESVVLYGIDTFEYKGVKYNETGTIKSLEDLKYFPDLTSIKVYLQPSIDYNTIPNKEKIFHLALSQNKISNINFLEGYNELINLTLSSNEITDLSGIQNLTKIKNLSLTFNKITDIDKLKELINLEKLELTSNQVKDLNSLKNMSKLKYLSLYENDLTDISPLSNIKSLDELYLNNNNITDISPLKNFESFKNLNVSGNPISNIEVINHIKNAIK